MFLKQKNELILEGLDCVNCAMKIEKEVNTKVNGVKEATFNFVTKVLTFETEAEDETSTITEQIAMIVKKFEPDVIVKEKGQEELEKKTLFLEGLTCAGCVPKIENDIKQIEGVRDASIDFALKKLNLEVVSRYNFEDMTKQISQTIKSREPHIEVFEEKTNSVKKDNSYINRKELWKLIVGLVLLGCGALIPMPRVVSFSMFLAAYIIVGGGILLQAGKNLLRGKVFDENFLMSIATLGAFAIGEYPEGVAVMLFYKTGEFFQSAAVNRSRKSIKELLDIKPEYANLKNLDDLKKVHPEEVKIGDIIVVKPGEKIPLDGTVIEGLSSVDTSALTGESLPRDITEGSEVLSGFINTSGVLVIEVKKSFANSTVSTILNLVENASSKKSPTENFITKFSRYYTPVVVGISIIIATIPPLVIAEANFSEWIYRALVFLVVSCPCALVISIPLGFFGGIGGASRRGVLIKGSNYLEALNNVGSVVFDKTGTLTKGVFKVEEVKVEGAYTKEEVLEYAAYAESYSNHPIAVSIIKEYSSKIQQERIEGYEEIAGLGIKVRIDGKEVVIGNSRLMQTQGIKYIEEKTASTIIYVAINNEYAGSISIADEIKEDSQKTIRELRRLGISKLFMLTGDKKLVGEKVANKLGLDDVYTQLLPHQKIEKLEELDKTKGKGKKIIFVGDGINDAPVLARADIGIAMGGVGSDAAIEAADVVLMTDEPTKIVDAINVAKKTRRVVMQNIIFALSVKAIVLILAAGGEASMWEAVFADVGVTLLAIFNSMRVLKVKKYLA